MIFLFSSSPAFGQDKTLRVGFLPNIAYAHALIDQNLAAEGRGWFKERLPEVSITWQRFDVGPPALEALLAKDIDLTYVGSLPALDAYLQTQGGLSVVAGAARGGIGLVVPAGSSLSKPEDFRGKRIAVSRLGNSMDITCRRWLARGGLNVSRPGGDVIFIPVLSPSILHLFLRKEIDAAFVSEPWISWLEDKAGGRLIYAEPVETSLIAVLAARADWAETDPELVRRFTEAHRELTDWIRQNSEEAQKRVADELTRLMKRRFSLDLLKRAWPRLVFDNEVKVEDFEFSLEAAQEAGFVKNNEDIGLEKLVSSPDLYRHR